MGQLLCINADLQVHMFIHSPPPLGGLSLFFKIVPISNTGVYILATAHFLYPKSGSFSDMVNNFYQLAHRYSKSPAFRRIK